MRIEDQKRFIDQLLETANPAGWNTHQKKRVRILYNKVVIKKPTRIAAVAG
jgi:hypothetical protein